ncbi:hypothetical protein [Glutamicibacter ardleyensis]|uniref:hypothetical protein n=1 Tax=Glutamicibacter ardleyensis TaxID=225894 RepID=UPI003FD1D31A
MRKINLRGKIAGKFTYHKADQELRPLTLQNKDPFHKTNIIIGVSAVGSLLAGKILPGAYLSQMLPILAIALACCFLFSVLMQFGINRTNDEHWKQQLQEKHKNSHLYH